MVKKYVAVLAGFFGGGGDSGAFWCVEPDPKVATTPQLMVTSCGAGVPVAGRLECVCVCVRVCGGCECGTSAAAAAPRAFGGGDPGPVTSRGERSFSPLAGARSLAVSGRFSRKLSIVRSFRDRYYCRY